MFDLNFLDTPLEYPYEDQATPAAYGQLIFDQHRPEGFLSSLSVWTKSEYLSHWYGELSALTNGRSRITLIVDLPDALFRANTEVWYAWLEGKTVYFHNRLLWGEHLPVGINPARIGDHTPNCEATTEDGQSISEWSVSIEHVKAYLQRVRSLE